MLAALMTLRHVLAAVHAAVAVAVGAAAVGHFVAVMLPGLILAMLSLLTGLMLGMLSGLVLLMVLMLGRRGLCDRRSGGEDERHRGDKDLHVISPETSIDEKDRNFRRFAEAAGPIPGEGRKAR